MDNVEEALSMLVDVLFGFAYDQRTTMGEATVESGWTIAKLSRTLSWLDPPGSVAEAVASSVHRALAFPVHRNWRLACRVAGDVAALLVLGRRAVVRSLVTVRRVLEKSGARQYLNTLFVEPLAVWVQGVSDATLGALGAEVQRCVPAKHDVRWDLEQLEAIALADSLSLDAHQQSTQDTEQQRAALL